MTAARTHATGAAPSLQGANQGDQAWLQAKTVIWIPRSSARRGFDSARRRPASASRERPGRRDLAAVVSEVPCAAAGVFTVNRMRAAPVEYAAGRLPAMGIRAIVANSGNANAITGPRGAIDERAVADGGGRRVQGHARRGADRVDGRDRLAVAGRAHARGDAGAGVVAGQRSAAGGRGDPHHRSAHQAGVAHDRARRASRCSSSPSARARG